MTQNFEEKLYTLLDTSYIWKNEPMKKHTTFRVGGPADICLFDPEEQWTVDATKLGSKSRNSPFDGMTLTGRVHTTICRGELVYQLER